MGEVGEESQKWMKQTYCSNFSEIVLMHQLLNHRSPYQLISCTVNQDNPPSYSIKWEVFKPLFPVSQLHYPVPITDDPCSDSCNFQPLTHIELLYFKGQHYDCILSTSTGKPSTTQPELRSTLPVCTIQLAMSELLFSIMCVPLQIT